MSYTINKFNGTQLIVLEDGTIDTSTSIGLVGRNYVGYGETQNENFVFLLENFANDNPPSRPIAGQTWYSTDNNLLYVYDGAKWAVVGAAVLSITPPEGPAVGELWLKTPYNTLYAWNGAAWTFIGPETSEGFGITRARSTTLVDSDGTTRPVIFLTVDGTVIGIATKTAFTIGLSNSVPGFASLVAGVTFSSDYSIKGNLQGLADRATRLETSRTINGVGFNGTDNITIKSSTTRKLVRGNYIVGSDFDGSSEVTWSVDASSSNSIGKVVVRNSAGGFAAGTITADLVGAVTGNVTASTGTSRFNIVEANQFIGPTLSGNADTATKFQTIRTINGVNFDGTADITVPANAQTLTGTYINNTVLGSNLTSVGTLTELSVANTGITIGSGNQFRLLVDSSTPTVRSSTGTLNFDMGASGPDVSFINASSSLALGGPNAPAIIGDNTTNLGIIGYKFNNIYANNLIGNADTATLATSANKLVGGGAGSIPYQTAPGVTAMLPAAAAGYILKSTGSGAIAWESPTFEGLTPGDYLALKRTDTGTALTDYTTIIPTTIYVDATVTNTAGKVVARDSNGDFAARRITAALIGNADTATSALTADEATHAIDADTATLAVTATNALYSTTRPNYDGSTRVATTKYVDNMVELLNPRSMIISAASPNLGTPDAQYADLINAHTPVTSVPVGATFYLTINVVYAGTSTSISAARWIMAYQWGTLSVGASTTLYNSSTGFKLTYVSNGSSWVYTGAWSYV